MKVDKQMLSQSVVGVVEAGVPEKVVELVFYEMLLKDDFSVVLQGLSEGRCFRNARQSGLAKLLTTVPRKLYSIPSSKYSLNNRNHMSDLLGSVHTAPAKLNYSPWAIAP